MNSLSGKFRKDFSHSGHMHIYTFFSGKGWRKSAFLLTLPVYNGAKICHATTYCCLKETREKDTPRMTLFIAYQYPCCRQTKLSKSPCHNGHCNEQRYCVTRLNRLRKLVCFRYCAIFEKISSGSTTWPNSKCLFCHLIVRVCWSHVVPFKPQRVIFHPEQSTHARYQNTSLLNILNITSFVEVFP